MRTITQVKLFNAGIDDDGKDALLRGSVALDSLPHLLVDDYQRESQPLSSQQKIISALKDGERLPALDLGMRGENFHERDGILYLKDPVYVIDGWQRVSTIIHYMNSNPSAKVQIGAEVHLNTTKEWERKRFHHLNNDRLKIAPAVLLRNMREHNPAILLIYGLTVNDKGFPMYGRVAWDQRMKKGELITGLTLTRTIAQLHAHKLAGKTSNLERMAKGLANGIKDIGVQTMRENIKMFFMLVDQCWGIRAIQYKGGACYLKLQFLRVLARVLSDHKDFWAQPEEKRLVIPTALARKIASFPISDPQVIRLAGSSGLAVEILYGLLRDHINSGKRTKRLFARVVVATPDMEDEDEEEAA